MAKHELTESYIESFLQTNDSHIEEMKRYASEHHVPIMEATGMAMMLQVLEIHKPKKILEIGTAIGYSAIRMVKSCPNAHIVTIERDEERLKIAEENIRKAQMEKQITVLSGDALHLIKEATELGTFDAIFIDAAKGQYERFFDLYEPLLNIGGVVISDNILFKGMVAESELPENKRMKQMVKRLKLFNERLMTDERFSSMIYPVGDGVMVSVKKEEKENIIGGGN
ncbi:O-methyltransferase [Bacillus shivajii]|uniref:O-methyltransferase n=1 Tax=Bacillus shivajii TaxID=1983719 RepID=UPI001CF96608|nr:O-methyltransferase [Bacillus shivajii]UCZ54390.1 O-methyltransferase [Bacillus shivajii]